MRQSVELSLGALMRILRIYLPSEWSPRRVCFVHQSPVDVSLHRRMFGPVLEFGAEFDGIICKSGDLETPIASSDPVMADYARRQVETALKSELPSFKREIHQLILILLPTGRCTVDQAARHLAMDRRTIHRRLAQGGQTFSDLVQAVRRELSDRYLEQRARSMSEIAELLGILQRECLYALAPVRSGLHALRAAGATDAKCSWGEESGRGEGISPMSN